MGKETSGKYSQFYNNNLEYSILSRRVYFFHGINFLLYNFHSNVLRVKIIAINIQMILFPAISMSDQSVCK